MSTLKEVKGGGVCTAREFVAGAICCGIKESNTDRVDLAIVHSLCNSIAAATFTTNQIKAAPVQVSKKHMSSRHVRAVVLNSGNANACTGANGITNALYTTELTANALGLLTKQVLTCSTGRIGVPLPMEKITPKIKPLVESLSRQGGGIAARAIMTSDTHPKEAAREFKISDTIVRVGGMAKGAGMINPNMATMLCVMTTDATISTSLLRKALREAVNHSFNRITIDGDMSTNDTVIVLANGASGSSSITSADSAEYAIFFEALRSVCMELAQMILLDGEGVSKFVEIKVRGANNHTEARYAAEALANSFLLKCAWAGNDPNWGRIMNTLGYSKAKIKEERVNIVLNNHPVVTGGILGSTSLADLHKVATNKTLQWEIDLNLGEGCYEVFTTDLTEETVRLNLGE